MFQDVAVPALPAPGRLYLHGLPGQREPLAAATDALRVLAITCVVCLAPEDELERESPDYAAAVTEGALAERAGVPELEWDHLPMTNLAPGDLPAFWSVARAVAGRLRRGERVLVHGGARGARAGTLAVCALLALGLEPELARRAVVEAGVVPEETELAMATTAREPEPRRKATRACAADVNLKVSPEGANEGRWRARAAGEASP